MMARGRSVVAVAFLFAAPAAIHAQGRGRGQAGPPISPREAAPVDVSGYWVSIVTEDWRYRMITPAKGDHPSIPLNAEGRRVADAWDPAKDEAAGNQCKAYGAGDVMRVPERLHITWEDDRTLKVETDAGQQTRLFHFGQWQPAGGEPTWQGDSIAQWLFAGPPGRGGVIGQRAGATRGGSLKVVTTHMRAGYLQKNGVPYSATAIITEHFDRTTEANGDSWLIVTTLIEDLQYLNGPFQRSTHFKKQADGAGWNPTACEAR